MPITQTDLARRLRSAREACQITQAEAARTLGISRSAISQMESGQRGVSGLELHRLARLYARDIRDFLEDRFDDAGPMAAMFRAHPELRNSPEAMASLRRSGELHRELTNLHEVLGLDRGLLRTPAYAPTVPKSRWDAVRQGRATAERERRRLDLGIAPLPELEGLLGAQGVSTALVRMDDGISGLTLIDADGSILVAANEKHHVVRRRFSFVHEYAHVLLDRELGAILSQASDRTSLTEVRANAFAAAFLMPEQGVRSYVDGLSKGRSSRTRADTFDGVAPTRVESRATSSSQNLELHDVVMMAYHFKVSCAAMLYRLKGLGLLTEQQRAYLARLDGSGATKELRTHFGLRELDDAEGKKRFRARFLSLAIEAYTRGVVTRRKLDELGCLVGARNLSRRLAGVGIGGSPSAP